MDEKVFLSWNLPNWITVVLMVAIGYLIFGLLFQWIMGNSGGGLQSFGGSASGVQPGGYIGATLLYGGATAGVSSLAA